MNRTFASLRKIINRQTLIVAVCALTSTIICQLLGLTGEFPLTIVGIAVVFPLVFSIGGAYKRREAALDDYGSIKAHGRAIFFASRDWIEAPDKEKEVKDVLSDLLSSCRKLFEPDAADALGTEKEVYAAFSKLSLCVNSLREHGLPSGEASRCNQYLSKMILAFENIKHIFQYRTPRTLRAYCKVFIYVIPIIYGPYFAWLASEVATGLEYMVPILFSVVLTSLDNIQEHLENPFDQVGEDDVVINVEKFVSYLDA